MYYDAINILIFALLGGLSSRICGGARPQFMWGGNAMFHALPYGLIFLPHWWAVIPFICATIGKKTGHVPYIQMGYIYEHTIGRAPALDPIVSLFFGEHTKGDYWRSFFGLIVTGLAVTLIPALIYGTTVSAAGGFMIALGGALKPIGYMIDWQLYKRGIREASTLYGENLSGFFAWGCLAIGVSL